MSASSCDKCPQDVTGETQETFMGLFVLQDEMAEEQEMQSSGYQSGAKLFPSCGSAFHQGFGDIY